MSLKFEAIAASAPIENRKTVSLRPSTFQTNVHAPDSLKHALIRALTASKGNVSAADTLRNSDLYIDGDKLEVRSTVSKTMLTILFNADCRRLIEKTLSDLGVSPNVSFSSVRPTTGADDAAGKSLAETPPFSKLRRTASQLNSISDKLSKQVQLIDIALKSLSLGVSTWVEVSKTSDEEGYEYLEEIGYAKFRAKWCIALRSSYTHPNGDEREESWPFADAPRQLRIEASGKIEDLLEKLSSEAENMISALTTQVDNVEKLTGAITEQKGDH